MSNLVLNFAIDTSGQPFDTIYVGLISIQTDSIKKFEKAFKKEFPKFYRFKEKGKNRKPSELKNIISFMNEKKYIKMFTTSLDKKEWWDYIKIYNKDKNVSFFKEKMYSLLYSYLFTKIRFRYKAYNAVMCEETYLDTNKVIEYCNFLNKSTKTDIILTKGLAKYNFLIRLADFIAAAHRKLPKKELKQIEKYYIYKLGRRDYRLINKILKK